MTEYKYIHLWATPIYHSVLESLNDHNVNWSKQLEFEDMPNKTGKYSTNKAVLTDEVFDFTRKEVYNHIHQYLIDHLQIHPRHKNGFYITKSWVNEFSKGSGSNLHIHENSLFSGVIYLDVPEDGEGELEFEREERYQVTPSTIQFDYNWNALNCKSFSIPAENKKIILFPSTLRHRITEITSDTKRYSLAFNIFYRGTVGYNEQELRIGI